VTTTGRVNVLAVIAVVVVAVTITAGLIVAGGPGVARQRRLDERRTLDLTMLVISINVHYTRHHALPSSLDTLRVENVDIPVDPVTRAPYRYEVTSATGYRLCATFTQPSDDRYGRGEWHHGIGPVCFDRAALTQGRNGN